jgi:hypothetical protein
MRRGRVQVATVVGKALASCKVASRSYDRVSSCLPFSSRLGLVRLLRRALSTSFHVLELRANAVSDSFSAPQCRVRPRSQLAAKRTDAGRSSQRLRQSTIEVAPADCLPLLVLHRMLLLNPLAEARYAGSLRPVV